ncbi:MAG: DNA primase [Hyphomicrobiaceae bacterium]
MRFPPSLMDEIRARLPVSQVVGRRVALKRAGREMRGLSPFKQEKTPSFFVNDRKGSWFDFSSGQNGDIFKFLMLTEGLSFPEAVERLAGEAGVSLPKQTAHDEQREDERTRLAALCEASARFFEARLAAPEGTEARRYLERRGLAHETIRKFRIGYAPGGRSILKEHLAAQGFTAAEMAASGMLIAGEDIPVSYDRFRNRVMFPISDLRDRIIAFGGRALEADAQAKYLNSPETPLFHKGSVLFNAARARQAAHDSRRVIAVEGYMDVVALVQAGFADAVAPLGTALTEDQLRILWRMAPEPVLCFDGDSAGRKAAFRAVETALPHLKPGASLMFAFLPDGFDPDDLVRRQGAEAMSAVLAKARPLADVLFEREWGSGDWSTPERRARLEQQLFALIARIGDTSVRGHYDREVRERLARAWGDAHAPWRGGARRPQQAGHGGQAGGWGSGRAQGGRPGFRAGAPRGGAGGRPRAFERAMPGAGASASLKQSRLVTGDAGQPPYREALLAKTLLNHPWLLEDCCEEVAGLTFTSRPLGLLRDRLLELQSEQTPLDTGEIRAQLSKLGLDSIMALVERAITHKSDRFSEPDAPRADVEIGWRHTASLHATQVGWKRALDAATLEFQNDPSEDLLARIEEIKRVMAEGLETEGSGDR